ncbi:DUF4236 domain-containing protein [Calderihabitans maritimus]|uniref:DUF4236 domain-containing protein n=1 Tax=Calderihabitans maritimus TaxID=1246530 RepID=A0A1Z5HY83_9FIRM|nr:DUF4236 domain-containing protein [Calderihabitans maritimus]GAW94358.1 hypothetical protein KKC1_34640 [Calderihabitans maritimus]
MDIRFRKSISLGKGVRLNVGKMGDGLSVGGKGVLKFLLTVYFKGEFSTIF